MSAWPRNESLEAAIRSDRSNPSVYEVYADWLQLNGSVLGELMVLQSSTSAMTPARRRRIAEILELFRLPHPSRARFAWRFGLWSSLHLGREVGTMDADEDVSAFARHLFALPMCAALEELRIGILRFDRNGADLRAVLHEAAAQPWAAELASLFLGDISPDITAAGLDLGDMAEPLSKAFPKLEHLHLRLGASPGALALERLVLPQLVELVVDADSLPREIVEGIVRARLPGLETLALGAVRQVDPIGVMADLARFPRLAKLVLVGTGALPAAVARVREALGRRIEVVHARKRAGRFA